MTKEIVVIVGYPCSGKTTLAEEYQDQNFYRLSQEIFGGSLQDINQRLEDLIVQGKKKFVIDNNYPTIASRKPLISIAEKYDFRITCVHLTTSIENSQQNSAIRIIKKTGKLLMPDEIIRLRDPEIIQASEIFNFRKLFEKPTEEEGFYNVISKRFNRKSNYDYDQKAIIFDIDQTVRLFKSGYKIPTSKEDIEILPGRQGALCDYKAKGYLLLAISNQNGIGKGRITDKDAEAYFNYTNELLGGIIDDFIYCTHDSYPIQCYCKKPMPGLGAQYIEKYQLDPSQCYMIVSETADTTFAKRCEFNTLNTEDVFADYENFGKKPVYK
jgi:HAD superfamily hydrolase (TIGR01662 family)